MIGQILTGLVAIASVLAGIQLSSYYRSLASHPRAEKAEAVDVIKLDASAVPIIRQGDLKGYVIVRGAVAASVEDVKASRQLLVTQSSEALFRAVYEQDELTDFSNLKPLQVEALSQRALELANAAGRNPVKKFFIENIVYMSNRDVKKERSN